MRPRVIAPIAACALVGATLTITGAPADAAAQQQPVSFQAAQPFVTSTDMSDLDRTWQRLQTDAFGNRSAHGWTITPQGTQARANASSSDCASGRTCLFQSPNFSGWIQSYVGPGTANLGSPYDNAMSSWINRNSRWATWYTEQDTVGTAHCMPANIQVSAVTSSEDNTASSLTIFAAGVTC